MNAIIKIGMICLICMAVMMSGCMESKDGQSSDGASDIPITLFADIGSGYVRIILEEDGTAEFCNDDATGNEVCTYGTWEKCESSSIEYDVTSFMMTVIHVTILDDGKAELETFGMVRKGTWTKGADR